MLMSNIFIMSEIFLEKKKRSQILCDFRLLLVTQILLAVANLCKLPSLKN